MPAQLISGDVRELPPDELRAVLKDIGVTRIDTAARYQNGESEKIIGRTKLSQDFTIDTKVLFTGPADPCLNPDAIEKSVSNSLQVLGMDRVNVLYCHAPDFSTPIADQAKAFNDQYKKGRFTHLGVSNLSADYLTEWIQIAEKEGYVKPSVYQGQYNLLCRSLEETLFPLLRKHGIKFAGYSPLAGGFLLGNFTADGVQGGTRFALNTPYNKWYNHASMHEAIKKLRAISEKTGLDMDELSFRWERYHSILNDEDVIIMGASKPEQIRSSVKKASNGPLDDQVAKELSDLWGPCRDDGMATTEFKKPE
ncbi:hypothetical protein M409DRAFT_67429 [Zasmidium cellare ATCC 36951]|uniref:NADP-dependent oxidoreductase domain-containing protein n=1 Tax=Zasmidium cellare ATCC 36951 TaxID=1080233 RepID=A0A6A6CEQ0_ZASCE|nr:uncharacterized protein M409DRAFT_67429 [Zasmidium cellare ATCC 36951]KAF2165153.1 hypothetical protein M409DRAFT_67429 [Zasmidium cellare ATCC 36951]